MFTFENILFYRFHQQGADEIYTSIWVIYDCLKLLADPLLSQLPNSFSME